jgi:hypothetical protein
MKKTEALYLLHPDMNAGAFYRGKKSSGYLRKSKQNKKVREPRIIINSSLPQKQESSDVKNFWIPAFAGMTFLEVAVRVLWGKRKPGVSGIRLYQKGEVASRYLRDGVKKGRDCFMIMVCGREENY